MKSPIRSDARKRREHVIRESGKTRQKHDTARTAAGFDTDDEPDEIDWDEIALATLSLHDDNQRER